MKGGARPVEGKLTSDLRLNARGGVRALPGPGWLRPACLAHPCVSQKTKPYAPPCRSSLCRDKHIPVAGSDSLALSRHTPRRTAAGHTSRLDSDRTGGRPEAVPCLGLSVSAPGRRGRAHAHATRARCLGGLARPVAGSRAPASRLLLRFVSNCSYTGPRLAVVLSQSLTRVLLSHSLTRVLSQSATRGFNFKSATHQSFQVSRPPSCSPEFSSLITT